MFKLINKDGMARYGALHTPHGAVETPVFMNVGTQAAIKGGLSAFDLEELGCTIELSNTYHLHLRPGEGVIKNAGGLHAFMGWNRPILTDSGGFQVFSLAKLRKITEEGVSFASHIDGAAVFIGPEESMRIQHDLGSDIVMAFDECVGNPAPKDYVANSCGRTLRWLRRCRDELQRLSASSGRTPMLFGINQGGVYRDLRAEHMKSIAELGLPGYAIGGLAVGETAEEMYEIIEAVEPHMPEDRPRYLMGVGTPTNIIEAVRRGVDFFDCVLPARNARHGKLYTWSGCINIKNLKYMDDYGPVEEGCACPTCARHSRAYLRHLFKAEELLALRLAVTHNLYFFNNMMKRIRAEISAGTFERFYMSVRKGLSASL